MTRSKLFGTRDFLSFGSIIQCYNSNYHSNLKLASFLHYGKDVRLLSQVGKLNVLRSSRSSVLSVSGYEITVGLNF